MQWASTGGFTRKMNNAPLEFRGTISILQYFKLTGNIKGFKGTRTFFCKLGFMGTRE